jgi:hypothetical protein
MNVRLTLMLCLALVLGLVGLGWAQELDPNLVAWWTLDDGEGTVIYDETDFWNDGTVYGGASWVTGRIGGALELDGVDDCVDCGNKESLNITGQITLAAWVRPDTAGNGQHQSILCKGDNSYMLKIQQWNNVEFFIYSGGWRTCTFPLGSAAAFNGIWHHLAGTFDGTQVKIYENGVLRNTANFAGAIATNTVNTCIGRDGTGSGRRYFDGIVDDARIYNRALSADEIKKLANPEKASSPVPANGEVITQTEVTLQWAAGSTAAQHKVYFGEDMGAVGADASPVATGDQTTYGPLSLELGKTYYWRVDEIEADGTTAYTGDTWSFTIQPLTAYAPEPADGAKYVDVNTDLVWKPGFKAESHDVYFGMDKTAVAAADKSSPLFMANQTGLTYPLPALDYGKHYYWRIDERNSDATVSPGEVWTFQTIPATPVTDPNLVGWWKMDDEGGSMALDWSGFGHNGSLVGDPNWVDGYVGGAIELDGFDDCVDVGNPDRLNLTTEVTLAAWIKPNTAANSADQSFVTKGNNSYGLRQSNTNTLQFRLNETTVASSPVTSAFNGQWHHLAGTFNGSQLLLYVDGALQATTGFAGAVPTSVYAVNIGREAVGNRFLYNGAIDEVRIYNRALTEDEIILAMRGDPLQAWAPTPRNGGVVDIRNPLQLSWSAGEEAVQHDVYLGTDSAAVENAGPSDATGLYRGRQSDTTYTPPDALQWGQTYYWRIDEVQDNGTITPGRLWLLTVADYLIVDDFEAYDDLCNRIFFAWSDGYGYSASEDCGIPASDGNGTNSTVGNVDPPFAGQLIVRSGRQSMPFGYDNSQSPFYSETVREWSTAQSWTDGGVDTLTLYLRGDAAAFLETAAGTFLMNGTGTDIWGTMDELRFAYKQLKGNGSIVARVEAVSNVNNNAKAGVMIRETLRAESAHAFVDVTPGAGLEFIRRLASSGDSTSTTQAGLMAPYWVKLTRSGNTFTAQCSADGVTWTSVGTDPAASSVTIPMAADVYIGLGVTSRVANGVCAARFSNVSTTDTVTGAWQTADIGIAQVAGNSPETFYVAVQDSAGQTRVVSHPDPAIIATGAWEAWSIPLSTFTSSGVNVGSIQKIIIGVGDRTTPKVGGTGKLYIDDIRVIKAN